MDGLATGGPIEPGNVPIIGEDGYSLALPAACDCAGCDGRGTPVSVTINIHGAVHSEKDLARIVREQVLRFGGRNGGGTAPA